MKQVIDLSIVVATKNRAPLLRQMLNSIGPASVGLQYEVIVVAGDSTDDTSSVLREFPTLKVISESASLGVGRHSWPELYNQGFRACRGRWVTYASDDTTFNESCFCNAIEAVERATTDPPGATFYYRNEIAEPGWNMFGIDFLVGNIPLLNFGILRRDILESIGYISTDYQFYCADADLTQKLAALGLVLPPLPSCQVVHHNLLDTQKQTNLKGLEHDLGLYQKRWSLATLDVHPRRMLLDPSFDHAVTVPLQIELPAPALYAFWHAIALIQSGDLGVAADLIPQLIEQNIPHGHLQLLIDQIKSRVG